ncbi:Septum site-determining protein MinC [hydrothermal vent metagenome]|uniref:Septum site-determining protein MinC n=1 Tax=hydrothermal vent metagenome TaxID=652676 RepID=A0A1W1CIW6_9ZZZZ
MTLIEVKKINIPAILLNIKSNNLNDLSEEITKIKDINKNSTIIVKIEEDIVFSATNLAVLIELITQNEMIVVGINTNKKELRDYAEVLGLVLIDKVDETSHALTQDKNYKPPFILDNEVHNEQIYSKEQDLFVTKKISNDVELLSDNSIYVHSILKGKVLAGIKGNKNAVIFVENFMAKLVSIAGIYRLFDEVPESLKNKTVLISLENESLNFEVKDV